MNTGWLLLMGGTVSLLLFRLMAAPIRRIWKWSLNLLCGAAILAIVRIFGMRIGLEVGLNIWNILLVSLLGLPGIGVILFLHWML